VASVDSVEAYGVAGKQARHDGGKGNHARAQEKMNMIGQDCEGVAGGLCLREDNPARTCEKCPRETVDVLR
jgi:hypothetical protein